MRTAVECPSSTRTAMDGPGRCAHSYGSEGRRPPKGRNVELPQQQARRLTESLRDCPGRGRRRETPATITEAFHLVSETGRNVGDVGDVRRSAHNPEVAGSNPAPATKARGPLSNRKRASYPRSVN